MGGPRGAGPNTRTLLDEVLAGNGDSATWNALMGRIDRHYLLPLRSYLNRAGIGETDLEDLLAEVRLALVGGRLMDYDPKRMKFRWWLFHYVVRYHLGRARVRAARRKTVPLPREIAAGAGMDGEGVEEGWAVTCIAQAVLDAVVEVLERPGKRFTRRGERTRDILAGVWIDGKTAEEVGKERGILCASVRYHLRRGRKRLLGAVLRELRTRGLDGGPFEGYCERLQEEGGGVEAGLPGARGGAVPAGPGGEQHADDIVSAGSAGRVDQRMCFIRSWSSTIFESFCLTISASILTFLRGGS